MNLDTSKRQIFMFAPYLAVVIGMVLLHNAFIALFTYNGLLALAVWIYRKDLNLIKDHNKTKPLLLIGAVLVCGSSGAGFYLLWPLVKLKGLDLSQTLGDFGFNKTIELPLLIYFTIIHSFIEESYWRFVLKNNSSSLCLSDFMFGGYHILVLIYFIPWYLALACFIILVIAAWLWRMIREKYHDHLTIYLSHGVADFSIIFFTLKLTHFN
ncbi:hypothetical protein [Spirochaeta cellobiosiphila]|uniref:hypothetical protein n=1 Tax=Spirochaeta cellobiosiphila TaxID=504483 RepID=UPI0003FFF55A|nr:hypothetical protein [Spirochaeta cellobiosiphila]